MNMFKRSAQMSKVAILATLLAAPLARADENKYPGTKAGEPTPKAKDMSAELARNLANFDDLDFRVYTGQEWQDFHKSHSKDVIVHWPDGHTTTGLEKHIEDLKEGVQGLVVTQNCFAEFRGTER